MYRLLLTILLCLQAASSAPQSKESGVTYVRIQPLVEDAPVEAASNLRESRIEKLPLTIPGNVSNTDTKKPEKLEKESNQSDSLSVEKLDNLSKNSDDSSEVLSAETNLAGNKSENLTDNLDVAESKQSDQIADASGTDEADTTDDLSEISPTDDLSESGSTNLSDTVPSETYQSDRRARNLDSETTETPEVTGRYEDGLIDYTAIEAPRTRTPPKFNPKGPQQSYLINPRVFQSYSSNLLDHVGKRNFRSHCSCQKIWNCPKLQITVPRCPNEYYLCCL